MAAVAAFPAFAGAQTGSPTDDQYGAVLQQVSQGQVPPTPPTPPNTPPPSTGLPFTGLDVVGLGAVALFLTLGGVALRRARFAESTDI